MKKLKNNLILTGKIKRQIRVGDLVSFEKDCLIFYRVLKVTGRHFMYYEPDYGDFVYERLEYIECVVTGYRIKEVDISC